MKEIISIIIFSLISLILTEDDISILFLEPFNSITIKNKSSACICVKMSDKIKIDENFYIIINSTEINTSINETLLYNFTNFCPENKCNEFEFNNTIEPNLTSNRDGFINQYNFIKQDFKYMLFRYDQYNGNDLIIKYSETGIGIEFIGFLYLYVSLISLFTIIVLIFVKIFYVNKVLIKKREKNNFIAPIFPLDNDNENKKDDDLKEIKTD